MHLRKHGIMKIQEQISKRKVQGNLEKQIENQKRRYQELQLEYNKESYQENPEIKREYQKRYNKKA